jgi:multicomponent Na+:H+ antiporter subunit B
VTPALRRGLFFAGLAGFLAFYLWGLAGLPGFGRYPGPYGFVINRITVAGTNATGIVSAVNFDYRGFDTVGEEFILFAAATGIATVLRHLRDEQEGERDDAAPDPSAHPASDAIRLSSLLFVGPAALIGWYLASHAQTSPSGGFQGGVVLATAFVLIYLSGDFVRFRKLSPAAVVDSAGAVGAAGFAATGLAAVILGFSYLYDFLPLGIKPGAVSSSGTIALISFFVGVEVGAAFILIVAELVEQKLLVSDGGTS